MWSIWRGCGEGGAFEPSSGCFEVFFDEGAVDEVGEGRSSLFCNEFVVLEGFDEVILIAGFQSVAEKEVDL